MSNTNIRRGDAGIYTAEGNLAGGLASRLAAKRAEQEEEYRRRREAIEQENAKRSRLGDIQDKFSAVDDSDEKDFKVSSLYMAKRMPLSSAVGSNA